MTDLSVVSITRVKNESDIVEAFVRHNASYVTRMLIEDDGSTDGTYEMLVALQAEGLPIELLTFPTIGYQQSSRVTQLAQLACRQYAADWVIPIDVDEFIEPPIDRSLQEVLAAHGGNLVRIGWSNFVWQKTLDDEVELNAVIRLRDRMPPRTDHTKVMIPSVLIKDTPFEIVIGSHDLVCDGTLVSCEQTYDINLCHYPIRSLDQYVSKLVTGYLQMRCSPFFSVGYCFQYDEPFERIRNGDESIAALVEAQSFRYSLEPEIPVVDAPTCAPLRYAGGPLSLTSKKDHSLSNILSYAERLANHHRREILSAAAISDRIEQMTPQHKGASALERLEQLRVSAASLASSNAVSLIVIKDLRFQRDESKRAIATMRLSIADLKSSNAADLALIEDLRSQRDQAYEELATARRAIAELETSKAADLALIEDVRRQRDQAE